MTFEENKGAIALFLLVGVAIGAWSALTTLVVLFLSSLVVAYSGWKHEPWLEHFFEP
ncbi:hypothetical protein [Ligilactobacillus apodemi]|uniref:hypothetical protein n=1 Tax=Ligilactobacillus apodemi TaxID=307126 RepID=UPI00214D04B1|nr:hypothetical protein [Ligilactobacillus apodemi]MCR1901616.1 hypothetical protein [Ligilactobacillus apodemi]